MDRKQILNAMEERFGVKAKYMGAPSFAYQIESSGAVFTIDRNGKITDSAGTEIELDNLEGFGVATEASDCKTEIEQMEISVPMEGHTGGSLRNLVNLIYSKQELLKKALHMDKNIVEKDFAADINDKRIITLGDFAQAYAGIGGCDGIAFDFNNSMITFILTGAIAENTDKADAVVKLISCINKTALELKHTSFKPAATDNEKFTMRTWLNRLGFIGSGYRQARKTLLEFLPGNGAYRHTPEKEECQVVSAEAEKPDGLVTYLNEELDGEGMV